MLSFLLTLWSMAHMSFGGRVPPPHEKPWSIKPVSITFDDGPHAKYTNAILDTLKAEKVPATFFVVGNRIPKNTHILQRALQEWHTIGNHSFRHTAFSKLTSIELFQEVLLTNFEILGATGRYPHFFRFPYGIEDARIGWIYQSPIIGWNVDAKDWKTKNPDTLARNIVKQTKNGSIILLHDIKSDTVAALPTIIHTLKQEGYTFVPLDTLIRYRSENEYTNTVFSSSTKHHSIPSETPTETMIVPL